MKRIKLILVAAAAAVLVLALGAGPAFAAPFLGAGDVLGLPESVCAKEADEKAPLIEAAEIGTFATCWADLPDVLTEDDVIAQ